MNKGKGKAGTKSANKGKNGGESSNVVYDYHEGSVHDVALRAQVLQGYEEFKVCITCFVVFPPAEAF